EQARALESARGARAAQAPPLVRQPRGVEAPLSFAQERLWFLDRLQPGSPAYNEDFTLRLAGPLRPAALAVGLEDVVRRHEVLRTSFAERDDLPVQVVGPPSPVSVPLVDLRVLPDASRLPEALRRCSELSRQPFDLACGPLLRASLLRLGGEEHLLSVVLHHIVCDAWSTGLLVREVAAVYSALGAGLAGANLPAPAVQYADFAIWQRHWLQGEALEAQLAYWRRRLAGPLRPLRLPRRRRPGTATLRSATVSAVLPATLLAQLQMLGRREGATLF